MKKIAFYIIWLVFSIGLAVLLIEGTGRLVIHFIYGIPGKSYGLWKSDPELGATHRKNAYNTRSSLNNYGFRNREDVFEPKPPNSLRIIAFGGSTTFGYNLKDSQVFTEKLEERLRRMPGYEKTQVLNAGRICYSAGHNIILIKRLVPQFKPDYVIVYEGTNEVLNSWMLQYDGISLDKLDSSSYGAIGKSYDQNRAFKRNSVIARFIDYYIKKAVDSIRAKAVNARKTSLSLYETKNIKIHPWIIENYRFLLKNILDFLNREKVKTIVIRYASIRNPEKKVFSDMSSEIAREKGTLIYDMQSQFDNFGGLEDDLFIYTGMHVTNLGASVMADGLYDVITKDLRREKR